MQFLLLPVASFGGRMATPYSHDLGIISHQRHQSVMLWMDYHLEESVLEQCD